MTTMIESAPAETIDELLPLEFMQLPVASEATLDDEPNPQVASAFTWGILGKKTRCQGLIIIDYRGNMTSQSSGMNAQ